MPELPVRFLPSAEVKTFYQSRFLPTGLRAVHVGWTRECEDW